MNSIIGIVIKKKMATQTINISYQLPQHIQLNGSNFLNTSYIICIQCKHLNLQHFTNETKL